MIDEEFPLLSPLLRLNQKPLGLQPALQRLFPTRLAVPLLAPQDFTPGRGLYTCSLGLSDLLSIFPPQAPT